MTVRILKGDCRNVLRDLEPESVHCVVTSPPYFGLRDYGVAGQIGLEGSFAGYVEIIRDVFRDVRRVLRADGTVWLNLGDSFAGGGHGGGGSYESERNWRKGCGRANGQVDERGQRNRDGLGRVTGLKPKDLCGIPWRVAFALQADGWWLRSDIIWSKPNPMPESVTDRPTKAHEYIFLLSKAERYYYDHAAIAEPVAPSQEGRTRDDIIGGSSWEERGQHSKGGRYGRKPDNRKPFAPGQVDNRGNGHDRGGGVDRTNGIRPAELRNRRTVWEITTAPFPEAHFATFPPALIEPCILAGCPKQCCAKCGAPWAREYRERKTLGFSPSCSCNAATVPGTCLDPFGGAGTTGLVADRLDRNAILIELNPEYAAMAERRIKGDSPLFAEVV